MAKADNKSKQPKDERRFSQEQYEMLKRCSDNKDITEWNEWRDNHPDEDVWLEGAKLNDYWLKGVNLGTYREPRRKTPEIYVEEAELNGAHLEGAVLNFAHLEGAKLHEAHLEGARLNFAHLEGAFLLGCHLEGAKLRCAHLKDANLANAHLENADLADTHIEGTNFKNATLKGVDFHVAAVSGSTSFCYCIVDLGTDFREVGLNSVRIDPQTKQLLEYNIRRMNWEEWYKEHPGLVWLVKPFWWVSDYGLSTTRIVATFFGLAFLFANIYYHWGRIAPPGIVSSLSIDETGAAVPGWLVPMRALYFSVVTMTTLGFGDMFARGQSLFGHLLLILQVLLGYVLLGALVTRFAVLFTAGGPAGKFAENETESAGARQAGEKPEKRTR